MCRGSDRLTGAGNCHRIQDVKIFITGATGFIGSHLVERLSRDRGTEIWALVRNPEKAAGWPAAVHILKGDLASIPRLPSDLDIVYHLAGLTKALKSIDYYTVNRQGTARLIQSLEAMDGRPRVVVLSSLAAAGPSFKGGAVKESDPPRPVDPYGQSKLLGEEEALARRDRFPLVIVRVGAVFGPGDKDFLSYFGFIKKGILPAFGRGRPLSLCYVKDLVRALALCAGTEFRSGEILNIGDPRPYGWQEIGETAGRILGKKLRRLPIPLPAVFLGAIFSEIFSALRRKPSIINLDKFKEMRQDGWVADVTKAERLLSFRTQYSLEQGLRETLSWYQEHGWL